jgi:hypothetical protein
MDLVNIAGVDSANFTRKSLHILIVANAAVVGLATGISLRVANEITYKRNILSTLQWLLPIVIPFLAKVFGH